ncbi:MAG: peptidoglycan DD-metalloendopeptidase family protein [Chitinophagales bacterium]|nr:peptidoglycan DD-metalloendopeptidase family protein [Chitinophagales bacterium]
MCFLFVLNVKEPASRPLVPVKSFCFYLKIILSFSFFLILLAPSSYAQNGQNKEDLEKKRDQIVNQINDLQKQLNQTKKSKSVNLTQLTLLQKKIEVRQKLIHEYTVQINQFDKQINEKSRTIRMLDRNLDTLKKNYANMIYYAYKHRSSYDKLIFLFSADNFNEAFIRLKYLKRYTAYRHMQADLILATEESLKKQMGVLKTAKKDKLQMVMQQTQQKDQLAAEKSEKDKMVKTLSGQEKKIKADLSKKKQEQSQLKKQIADLIRKEIEEQKKIAASAGKTNSSSSSLALTPEAAALSASFENNQGKLPWPVEKGEIIESFGEHPHPLLENVKMKNNGVDIKTGTGASVRALFKGKVVSILSNPGYHKAILIKHGEYFTVYSNLASVNVKTGEEISTKQSIGTVYNNENGITTVHLEIWKGTTLLDPENWLLRK